MPLAAQLTTSKKRRHQWPSLLSSEDVFFAFFDDCDVLEDFVGAATGARAGALVGACDGRGVGPRVGATVGLGVGRDVGLGGGGARSCTKITTFTNTKTPNTAYTVEVPILGSIEEPRAFASSFLEN